MKIKKSVYINELSAIVDNEGFWYALTMGGYLKAAEILDSKEDIKRVEDAVNVLREFEELIPCL